MAEQKESFLEKLRETPPRKWTYETCREVAVRYTFQRDMRRENRNALDAARRNGWIKDFGWLIDGRKTGEKRPRKWTYEACLEEAKKYETVSDFQKGCGGAYNAACKNGWIKECTWFIDGNKRNALRHIKWTHETCLGLAKQCTCSSEMAVRSSAAYARALENGWLKEYSWFCRRRKSKWTYEGCRSIALKYKVKKDFKENDASAYQAAIYYGWMKSFDWFINGRVKGVKKPITTHHPAWNRKYSDEEAEEVAKKYKIKADFRKNDEGYYYYALRRHIMPKFTWLQSEPHLFNAINYVYRYYFQEQNAVYVGRTISIRKRDRDHRKYREKESSSVLKFAQKHGVEVPEIEILERGLTGEESQIKEDDYVKRYSTEGMFIINKGATGKGTGSLGNIRGYTKRKILAVAKQYKYLYDFHHEYPKLYDAACRYGWIHDFDFLKRKVSRTEQSPKQSCSSGSKK